MEEVGVFPLIILIRSFLNDILQGPLQNVHNILFLSNKATQTLHGMKVRTAGDRHISFVY